MFRNKFIEVCKQIWKYKWQMFHCEVVVAILPVPGLWIYGFSLLFHAKRWFALASTKNTFKKLTSINWNFMKRLVTFLETFYQVIKVKLWPWTQDELPSERSLQAAWRETVKKTNAAVACFTSCIRNGRFTPVKEMNNESCCI